MGALGSPIGLCCDSLGARANWDARSTLPMDPLMWRELVERFYPQHSFTPRDNRAHLWNDFTFGGCWLISTCLNLVKSYTYPSIPSEWFYRKDL